MNNIKEKILDFIWIFYDSIKNIFSKRIPTESFEDHTNKNIKYNVYLKNISYVFGNILDNDTMFKVNSQPVTFESANTMINEFIEECEADHDLVGLLDDIIFEIEEVYS